MNGSNKSPLGIPLSWGVGVSETDSIRLLPQRHSIVSSEFKLVCVLLFIVGPQLIVPATDWLCEAHFFDQLIRDEWYAEQRLGLSAPTIGNDWRVD